MTTFYYVAFSKDLFSNRVRSTQEESGVEKENSEDADSLMNEGKAAIGKGEFQTALEKLSLASDKYKESGDAAGEGEACNYLGIAYYRLGQYQKALEFFKQALSIYNEIEDKMVKKLFQKRINEILDKFYDKEIIISLNSANFFGQQSLKSFQIRGNGVLILTQEELYFEMWHPKKILQIPRFSILKIEITKSFLNKSVFRKLLKVVFTNKEGEEDAAAWWVTSLDKWIEELEKIKH